jgi:hypothetical protein
VSLILKSENVKVGFRKFLQGKPWLDEQFALRKGCRADVILFWRRRFVSVRPEVALFGFGSYTKRDKSLYSAALASTTRKTDSSPVTLALPMTTF